MSDAINQKQREREEAERVYGLSRMDAEGSYFNEGSGHDGPFDRLREECGVFGVFGYPDAASLTYYGLHTLQH
ncbi:amidophosphoribosyltransferase, partial [Clostridium perfringens]|nr:amidophosphoribosyltransferase [Clostridium perfringens]